MEKENADKKPKAEQEIHDYTKWRRTLFEDMTLEEFAEEAVAYAKAHPHKGKGNRL